MNEGTGLNLALLNFLAHLLSSHEVLFSKWYNHYIFPLEDNHYFAPILTGTMEEMIYSAHVLGIILDYLLESETS